MAYIQLDINLKTRETSASTPTLNYSSLENLFEVGEYNGLSKTLVADMEEEDDPIALPINYITEATFLYIESDQVLDIRIDAIDADAITGTRFLLTSEEESGFSSVYIKNTSGEDANVSYLIGGDVVT